MIPPIRKANDEDPGLQDRTGIGAGATGFQVGAHSSRRVPAIGAELDKDAQVWEVYVDETDRSDRELVKGWNDSLDVLLIFAALFSAITTALVIESSKRLQPDPAETSAQTLQAMSHILIAISNGQPVDISTSSSVSPSRFSPSRSSVLVNALWYLSLTLSVAVSLVAMVAKSWCNVFMCNRSGPRYEQGRRRQRKWNAIETWGMEDVFVYLPTLMHLALLLFAIGLSVYLWDLCISVAVPVLCVTTVFVSLYVVATILPSVHRDCPYSTPLSKPLNKAILLVNLASFLHCLQRAVWISQQTQQGSRDSINSPGHQATLKPGSTPMDKVTCQMLLWLIRNCEDSQLVDIALQSIAGARPGFPIETLAEADVTKMVVQRLNSGLRLDSTTSIEAVPLYAQALARLLESDAGFKPTSKQQVTTQLNFERLNAFFEPDLYKLISELKNLNSFSSPRLADDGNIATIATSIAMPLYYHMPANPRSTSLLEHTSTIQFRNNQIIQSHLNREVAIDSRALLALLEAAPYWIIRRTMHEGNIKKLRYSIMLLVQLIRSPSCSGPEFQYAIGLALTVAAVLMHDYPGWEHPPNSIDNRTTRAIEVCRYYKAQRHEEPKMLVVFGLLGLLGGISQTPTACSKHEVAILADILTQIGNFPSVAGFCLHTLPDTLTIMQHAKMVLLGTLQAVVDGRSDFGEKALILCLMELLLEVDAPSGFYINEADLKKFWGAQNSRLRRRICSKLLFTYTTRSYGSLEELELAQMSRLVDVSLGDDAYSAPTAMTCLWRLTERSIKAVNGLLVGGQRARAVLDDVLKHDAFTLLRAKALDLPVSPRNIFETGFVDMWYPLLKEMKSHKHAASIVDESKILMFMLNSAMETGAVPYLEELRDGRSWYHILIELCCMSSCDVEV
ncbi:hypothetical protein FRC12_001203 [Ceratobasidium sp. 428]|nr:hypothetical protein FRC12_001203 [Ceratobasidium sp. 428]